MKCQYCNSEMEFIGINTERKPFINVFKCVTTCSTVPMKERKKMIKERWILDLVREESYDGQN